jgi:PBP1b-binding outer membrane lipoprotein LpoB
VQHKVPKVLLFTALILAVVLSSCASAPVQDMSNARQAIAAAQQAGAERTAAKLMAEAQQLLDLAQAALDQGDYNTARQNAIRARSAAEKALRISQDYRTPP